MFGVFIMKIELTVVTFQKGTQSSGLVVQHVPACIPPHRLRANSQSLSQVSQGPSKSLKVSQGLSVWFGICWGHLFICFWGPFWWQKQRALLNPFAMPNQQDYYHPIAKKRMSYSCRRTKTTTACMKSLSIFILQTFWTIIVDSFLYIPINSWLHKHRTSWCFFRRILRVWTFFAF